MMTIRPVTLAGRFAQLVPLQMSHAAELNAVSQDPTIWSYMSAHPPRSLADMEQIVGSALAERDAGHCQPFAIIDLARGCAVGSTRYHNWQLRDHGIEIGWTWLASSAQRTGINTECKYLLMRHAFEELGAIRLQLRTHHLNTKSQQAIERIGATREGMLRNHMIMPDGSYRHSVFYSVIVSEWPQVKQSLEAKLR